MGYVISKLNIDGSTLYVFLLPFLGKGTLATSGVPQTRLEKGQNAMHSETRTHKESEVTS